MSIDSSLNRGLFHIFGCLVFPVAALLLSRVILLSSLGAVTFIFSSFEGLRLRVAEEPAQTSRSIEFS